MPNNTFITVDQFDFILSEVTKKISDTYTRNDSNVRTKTIFIFKYSDGLPEVMPSWVNWDVITDIVTIDGSSGWSLDLNAYEEDLDSHRYLWMSSTNINSLSQDNVYWSAPVRLSGERGPAGVDGALIEYIYKLTQNSDSTITTPSRSNWKQEGWTDHPSGITLQYQAEWVSTRKKETAEQDWTDWSTPALWSKYGVNGLDGDGYEYIYYRNNGENRPSIPSYNINSQHYQTDEYVPLGWTDDPQDVTASQRYLWMSSRKKQNGRWGDFKPATMWAKYGEQGEIGYINKKMYYKGDPSGTPPYKPTVVNPSGWTSVMPSYIPGDYVWMIEAYFNSKNEFVDIDGPDGQLTKGWSTPILVSGIKGNSGEKGEKGEKGEIGPVGDKGASGLPGSDMLYRYSLGNEDQPLAINDEEWQYTTAGLHPTEEYPYIWAQLGRKSYSFVETEDGEPTLEEHITWEGEPFKLTGMPGENGAGGQIIYPAGVYSTDIEYTTNDKTAPYVYFDNEYYVLNVPGTWCAKKKQSPTGVEIPNTFTPLDDIGEFGTKSWVKFESFSAIHAQIGIIENGLIGSAVFNGDYMFSQYGLYNGTEMEGLTDAEIRRCFENFDPLAPYSDNAIFKPNTCFNFKTGKVWLNAGKTTFNIDGSGQLAGGQITWKKNGDIEFGPGVKVTWQQVDGGDDKLKELRESLESKIKDAGGLSTSDLDDAKNILMEDYKTRIQNLKDLLDSKDESNKEILQAKIDALTQEQNRIHTTIESLRGTLGDVQEGIEGALTEAQINEIIQAGLKDGTFWTEDTIGSETVLGRKIVGLIGTFGSVDAEKLTGNTIKGKTVRSFDDVTLIDGSTGPSWQIRNDGAGYFAAGNIRWNSDGELSAKINGSFDGGSNGSLANGALTWDANAVYVHENLIFDSGKGISWENITGTENIATKDDIVAGGNGVTEEMVTNITKNTIQTENLIANNLTVKKVNTTGSGNSNNIVIDGNNLYAYNGDSKPSLTVNGGKFTQEYPMNSSESYEVKTDSSYPSTTIYKDLKTLYFKSGQKDCWIEVGEQYFRLMLVASINTGKSFSGTVEMKVRLQVYNGSTVVSQGSESTLSLVVKNNQTTNNGYTINASSRDHYVWYSAPVLINSLKAHVGDVDSDKAYTVKLQITPITSNPISASVAYLLAWGVTTSTNDTSTFNPSKLNISTWSSIDTTNIGDNGFRTAFDSHHFVEFAEYNGNTSMLIYSKGAGIKVTDDDLYLKFGNVWYKCGKSGSNLTLTEQTGGDQSVFEKYGKLNSNYNPSASSTDPLWE